MAESVMKAYLAITEVDYEGAHTWGAFDNLEDAKACALRNFGQYEDECYVDRWEGEECRLLWHKFRDGRRKLTFHKGRKVHKIELDLDD